ncbi:MAG: glycosyltransferase family 4 protein [Microgenomates group bacterium]
MKKAGIYDPYLDTLGGGERYMMTAAECLLEKNWQVDIFWNHPEISSRIKDRLGINLNRVNFVEDIFYSKKNLLERIKITQKYDLIFYLSDGSVPFLFAKKNILHFQVPFHGIGGKGLLNKIKLKSIDEVVCNSRFTKKFIDKEYGVKSKVIYPPVAVEEFKPSKKNNIILSVGRFSRLMQAKRQDVLVDTFGQMAENLSDWQLILAGGTDVGKDKAFDALKKKARNLPVKIIENPSFSELKKLYAQAKIFWAATGFGVEENRKPEKVEHFGITTVEAMAAGCVPLVIAKGGQKEIVNHGVNGFLWQKKEELMKLTQQLIKDDQFLRKLSLEAIKKSKIFSRGRFCEEFSSLVF